MGQGFTLIYRFKFAGMDEFVFKPREFCRAKRLRQPVDHVPYRRNTATTGTIPPPNIVSPAQFNLQRYYLPAKRTGIGRPYTDSGAVGDGPVAREQGGPRSTCRKTRAASQPVRVPRATFWRSS